ncbi:hypothetical protein ACWEIK_04135 [Streptomyces sp. NPDC004673]
MEISDVLARMVKTGRLGPVFVGADWHDVTEALGEPWLMLTGRRRWRWPRLYGHGDLEMSVCRCRKVSLVSLQTGRQVVQLSPALTGGTGTFPAGPGYADVVAALDRADCPWEPYASLTTFADQCTLVATPSGAHLTFEIPEGEEPVLNCVDLLGDGHVCPQPDAGRSGAA